MDATSRDLEPSISGGTAFAKLMAASVFRHRLPEPEDNSLPTRQDAHGLVQYYMGNIYALYPAFPETAIWATLDNIYQAGGEQSLRNADYWLFWTVLAVASSAQSRSSQDVFYKKGVEFIARAVPFAEKVLTPGYASTIPSLVLLTQYAMYDPRHFDTWHCMGFTARVVLEMGLHQDPPSHNVRDRNDLELRRKMFHCVYALDRYVAVPSTHGSTTCEPRLTLEIQGRQHGPRAVILLHRLHGRRCHA